MERQDISNLLYYHQRLIEDWLKTDKEGIQERVSRADYYGSIEKLPYLYQDSIKLLAEYGYQLDWNKRAFIP